MFGFNQVHTVTFNLAPPGASETVPIMLVDSRIKQIDILSAYVSADANLAAGTSNGRQLNLVNMGTAGTATTVISSVAGAPTGGTFAAWTANTPVALSLTAGTLTSGQYLGLQYTLNGADASVKNLTVSVNYQVGKGH